MPCYQLDGKNSFNRFNEFDGGDYMPIGLSHHRIGRRILISKDNYRVKNQTFTPVPSLILAGNEPRGDRRLLQILNDSSGYIFISYEEEFDLDDNGEYLWVFPGEILTFRLSADERQDLYARTEEIDVTVKILEVF